VAAPSKECREATEAAQPGWSDRGNVYGGSNPLTVVVAASDGGKLNTGDAYDRMWNLQRALENHKGVGTVISLPVLLAEGKRHPFAFLFSKEHLLKKMEEPKYERVARTFVTHDRTQSAFYLRMEERGRVKPRVELVADLREIVRRHGFKPVLVGGIYQLQGELVFVLPLLGGARWKER